MGKENMKRVRESHPLERSRGFMHGLLMGAAPRRFPDDWGRWTDDARASWQDGCNDSAEARRCQDQRQANKGDAMSDVPSWAIHEMLCEAGLTIKTLDQLAGEKWRVLGRDGKWHEFATRAEARRGLDRQAIFWRKDI